MKRLVATLAAVLLALALVVVACSAAHAAPASAVVGSWTGELDLGNGQGLHLIIRVAGYAGALTGTLESPDQGPGDIPLDSVVLSGNDFSFKSARIDASYDGTLSSSGKSIAGIFTQHGMQHPLNLAPYSEPKATGQEISVSEASQIVGAWTGKIEISANMSLRVVFTFARTNGVLTGTMTSPDQSPVAVQTQPRFDGKKLDIKVPANGGAYHGTLEADHTIHGTWTQSGQALTLDLARGGQAALPDNRPQTPRPPFPYDVRDVTFPGGAAGVTLAGTLTEPSGAGPFPAVALICGSGPNDRDETLFGHKPFLVIADYLTRRGIAVLRYDKRGVSQSSGNYTVATSADFADDALAAVKYLKSRSDVEPSHIGLIGHSEGGMIVPMCAAKSKDVAFIVMLAGDGVRGDKLMSRQIEALMGSEGASKADILKVQDYIAQEYASESSGDIAVHAGAGPNHGIVASLRLLLKTPWGRYFLTYDPAPTLRRVTCPVLALDGSLDLQVDAAENLAAIKSAVTEGGNEDVTVRELPGLNHLFQPAKTGSPAEYAAIETTIDPSVLTIVGDWITAHVTAS